MPARLRLSFFDKKLRQHFGSEERVLDALRLLMSPAKHGSRSVAWRQSSPVQCG